MIKKIRHWAHYHWNRSMLNPKFNPWISECICCCSECEDEE